MYLERGLTTFEIADRLNCSQGTVWKRLKEFGITSKLPGVKRVELGKEFLYELYILNKLSTWQIEKLIDIPRGTIYRKLIEFDINIRDRSDSHLIYPRKNFSGDLIEKAYLIGFRIGDLRARKMYNAGKTISLACSSTIYEQIELIEKIFGDYGRVWVKRSPNVSHVEVFLDMSFDFLLPKKTPDWIFNNEKHFYSFLSGFIDAEGHIGVYRGMAKFGLGNYDSELLFLIHKKLNFYGVKCGFPKSDNRMGKKNNQGYKYNHNYWQLNINRMNDLDKLFGKISPHIKHANKIKDLNRAIENINNRRNKKNGRKK